MRALLNVNVWIALFDDAHQFSDRANLFHGAPAIQQVRERLREACSELDHAFWPDDVSLRDDELFNFARVQGHNQITDLYLLALAVRHSGCLVSFDQGIALSSVHGARPKYLLML